MAERFLKERIIQNKMISIDFRPETTSSPIHTHDFLELIYVYSGNAVHIYNGKQTQIGSGEYVFIDFNSEHSIKEKSEGFNAITCTFVPEFVDSTLPGITGIGEVLKSYNINLVSRSLSEVCFFDDRDGRILRLLELMLDEYRRKDAGYLSIIRSCLIQILVLTARRTELVSSRTDERIGEIADYVYRNYSEGITLDKVSRKFYCSLSNISILFKKQMGMTFTEYLRKVRLSAACRLLVNTDKSVGEIAEAVGYSDVRSFRKHFRDTYGMTPLRFRKNFCER